MDSGRGRAEDDERSMIIYPGLLASGLLLLLFPADRLLSRRVKLRSFESFQSLEDSPRHRPWWWVPMLWLDPVRAFAGVVCLKLALATPAETWEATEKLPYFAMVAGLGATVAWQMHTRRDREALLAPMGFAAGVVAGLAPWVAVAAAAAVGLLGMFAFRSFHAFFGMALAGLTLCGAVLEKSTPWLIPSLVAVAAPMAVGFFSGRTLEVPTRDSSGREQAAATRP